MKTDALITFFSEVLILKNEGTYERVEWMRPPGEWSHEQFYLRQADVEEDQAKRKWLCSLWRSCFSPLVSEMPPPPSISGLGRIPPFPQVFRWAASAALGLLVSRWVRGTWPLAMQTKRRSVSEVCAEVGVDSGHMSRVLGGVSSFSIDTTDRMLALGGFRWSLIPRLDTPANPTGGAADEARFAHYGESGVAGEGAGPPFDPVMEALRRYTVPGDPRSPWWAQPQSATQDSPYKWMQELRLAWTRAPEEYSASHVSRLRRGQREFSWESLADFAREFQCDLVFVPRHFPMGWAREKPPGDASPKPSIAAAVDRRSSPLGIFARGYISSPASLEDRADDR